MEKSGLYWSRQEKCSVASDPEQKQTWSHRLVYTRFASRNVGQEAASGREDAARFPVLRWWETTGLCDSEQVIFDAIRTSPSLLDIGAGDLRIMRKLQAAGYRGEHHTQDIGGIRLHLRGLRNSFQVKRLVHFPRFLNFPLHMLAPLRAGETSVRSQIRGEFVRPSKQIIEVAG